MKKLLLAAVALVSLAPALSHAQQRAPQNVADAWCRDQPLDRGTVQICMAYTYEQCMASRTSHTESCYLNPRYDPRFRRN